MACVSARDPLGRTCQQRPMTKTSPSPGSPVVWGGGARAAPARSGRASRRDGDGHAAMVHHQRRAVGASSGRLQPAWVVKTPTSRAERTFTPAGATSVGAPEGIRTPNLLIRRKPGFRPSGASSADTSVTCGNVPPLRAKSSRWTSQCRRVRDGSYRFPTDSLATAPDWPANSGPDALHSTWVPAEDRRHRLCPTSAQLDAPARDGETIGTSPKVGCCARLCGGAGRVWPPGGA